MHLGILVIPSAKGPSLRSTCLEYKSVILLLIIIDFLVCVYFSPKETLSNIPSVVIEPASNNEEDHDVVVNESKDAVEDVGAQGAEAVAGKPSEAASEPTTIKDVPSATSEEQAVTADDSMPPGFLFKVSLSLC